MVGAGYSAEYLSELSDKEFTGLYFVAKRRLKNQRADKFHALLLAATSADNKKQLIREYLDGD